MGTPTTKNDETISSYHYLSMQEPDVPLECADCLVGNQMQLDLGDDPAPSIDSLDQLPFASS